MALAAGIVIVVVLALAVVVAVLSAIAAAIEVLPSHPGRSQSEPLEDQRPARAAGDRRRAVSFPCPENRQYQERRRELL